MPLRTQNVPIPLGGGLREDADAHRRPPQFATEAQRAVVRNQGSYQKAPGWTRLPGLGDSGASGAKALAVSSQGSLLVAGQDNNTAYDRSGSGWVDYGPGWIPPVGVAAKSVLALRGQIVDIGVAHHAASGYTALYAKHYDDLADPSGHLVAVIVDSDGNTVMGPYEQADHDWFPRVEAVTNGSGEAVFLFFGLSRQQLTYSGIYTLSAWSVNTTAFPSSAPSATTISAAVNTPTALDGRKYLYDTHAAAGEDTAYVVYYNGNELVARTVQEGPALSSEVVAKTGTPGGFQIFHDEVSETVLIAEAGAWDAIYYADEALSSFVEVTGLHVETGPLLYKHADGTVVYSGETISLAGTGPATPSFSGTEAYKVTGFDSREPQPWTGHTRVMLFESRDGGVQQGGAGGSVTGVRTPFLEASFLYGFLVHDDFKPYPAVPIMRTRHAPHVPDGFLTPPSAAGRVGHVPQTAVRSDGVILVPAHTRVPASRAWPFIGIDEESYFEGHVPNQDHHILLVELSPNQADVKKSVVEHRRSTVIAAGGLHCWDGETLFDIPGPPLITEYDDGVTTGTGLIRSDHSELDAGAGTFTHINFWAMRAVLVYTDRNGVEWRSAPSPIFTVDGIDNNDSAQCPAVKLQLDDTHQRILEGGSYDVEFYVTARDDGTAGGSAGGATEADIVYDFYLAQRTPLQYNGTAGYHIPDLLKFAYAPDSGRTPFALYTDSDELAPAVPPATSILAESGGYLFLVPDEFPDELWPSKPLETGRGPEWPPEMILQAPSGSGGIVSLAGVGDRLVVLCKNGVYEMFTGSGPDATGAGAFSPIRRIHRGAGCTTHRATVETPMGVFYATRGGFRLVTRQGVVEDVGGPVQDSIGDTSTIRAALYKDETSEVWVFTPSGVTYIFNLESGAWTQADRATSSAEALDATLVDGDIYQVRGVGYVEYEDATVATDGATFSANYGMSITTAWLTFDKHTSYFRCRKLHVLLRDRGGSGDIRIDIAYDYDDSVVDAFRFRHDGSTGWSGFERGGHFTVRLSRQKFDAIKVRIYEDSPTSGGFVEEGAFARSTLLWDLTGLELEVGVKRGGIKLQADAKK